VNIIAEGYATVQPKWSMVVVPHHGRTFPSQPSTGRFQKWFTKLKGLAQLKDGWDSYKAPKPSQAALTTADLYLKALKMLAWEPARVEASVMGGVGITHRKDSRKVYVEFYNDGKVHALFSDRTNPTPRMETAPVGSDISSYYRFIRKAREYLNV
jgi:hypothetical protein